MPNDDAATIASGDAISLPDSSASTEDITRLDDTTFTLVNTGTYLITYQASIDEPGQLGLSLNGSLIPYSVSGRATGTNQIYNSVIIEVTTANSTLSLVNPEGNTTALTLTPSAGGTHPVTAHLVIVKIA